MPARVAKDRTKAACVTTVTTPKATRPSVFEIRRFVAKVATAATTMPITF
jgi:hypothetical protein